MASESSPQWQVQFKRLCDARKARPGARDDQLLMDMLIEAVEGSSKFDELAALLNEAANSSIFDRVGSEDQTWDAFWRGAEIGVVVGGRQFFVQIKVWER